MIDLILNHLKSYLEQNIKDCSFFVGNLPRRDAIVQNAEHGVYITLLTISEDTAARSTYKNSQSNNRESTRQKPPIILELTIMISAFLEEYIESLKAISIHKLSDKSKFKLEEFNYSVTMYNLSMDQSTNLWQALSTNILPNVIYKIRYIC